MDAQGKMMGTIQKTTDKITKAKFVVAWSIVVVS
jgi:hypothetical protein